MYIPWWALLIAFWVFLAIAVNIDQDRQQTISKLQEEKDEIKEQLSKVQEELDDLKHKSKTETYDWNMW